MRRKGNGIGRHLFDDRVRFRLALFCQVSRMEYYVVSLIVLIRMEYYVVTLIFFIRMVGKQGKVTLPTSTQYKFVWVCIILIWIWMIPSNVLRAIS